MRRRHGLATSLGIESFVLDSEQCARLHPLLDPAAIHGGLYVPGDGLAKAVRAGEAQARRAIERGARFLARHRVTGIAENRGRVAGVITDQGTIDCDVVVCAAGFWGAELGAMVGLTVPLTPMAHQYAKTGVVGPLLLAASKETYGSYVPLFYTLAPLCAVFGIAAWLTPVIPASARPQGRPTS